MLRQDIMTTIWANRRMHTAIALFEHNPTLNVAQAAKSPQWGHPFNLSHRMLSKMSGELRMLQPAFEADGISGTGGTEALRVAVVGSGIAGLSCAWLLSKHHHVTLYEAAGRLGGHANTVVAQASSGPVPVDTGFIVYNEKTYPNLSAMLGHLEIATQPSCMSFGVSLGGGQLEYGGHDLHSLFAQKRNILRPRFWSMLRDLRRFYRDAPGDSVALEIAGGLGTLGEYLDAQRLGHALQHDHLLPMAAAIWSCSAETMRDIPAAAFIRFCQNHGLLQVADRPVWRSITGGSCNTVAALAAGVSGPIMTNSPIRAIAPVPFGTTVQHDGGCDRFDQVVIATHADQALAMLADPSAEERRILGAMRTSTNRAVLHTDETLMPRRRGVWSSWNYIDGRETGRVAGAPTVTYWMNRLQNLPGQNLFVTLNPEREPAAGTVLQEEQYTHPVFDTAALVAQRKLWSLQGVHGRWFCGAYFGAGFHEDGLQAGLAVAEAIGGVRRPWSVENESGRIRLPAYAAFPERVAA